MSAVSLAKKVSVDTKDSSQDDPKDHKYYDTLFGRTEITVDEKIVNVKVSYEEDCHPTVLIITCSWSILLTDPQYKEDKDLEDYIDRNKILQELKKIYSPYFQVRHVIKTDSSWDSGKYTEVIHQQYDIYTDRCNSEKCNEKFGCGACWPERN